MWALRSQLGLIFTGLCSPACVSPFLNSLALNYYHDGCYWGKCYRKSQSQMKDFRLKNAKLSFVASIECEV